METPCVDQVDLEEPITSLEAEMDRQRGRK